MRIVIKDIILIIIRESYFLFKSAKELVIIVYHVSSFLIVFVHKVKEGKIFIKNRYLIVDFVSQAPFVC